MNKPIPKIRQPLLDYHECVEYLRDKYSYEQDALHHFWSFILDYFGGMVCGATISFANDTLTYSTIDDSVSKEIIMHLLEELGEGNDRAVTMKIEW